MHNAPMHKGALGPVEEAVEARGMTCDKCGAPITVCFFIKLCDDCMEALRV